MKPGQDESGNYKQFLHVFNLGVTNNNTIDVSEHYVYPWPFNHEVQPDTRVLIAACRLGAEDHWPPIWRAFEAEMAMLFDPIAKHGVFHRHGPYAMLLHTLSQDAVDKIIRRVPKPTKGARTSHDPQAVLDYFRPHLQSTTETPRHENSRSGEMRARAL